ncbi:MAG: hypothetical protein ACXABF_13245 [Candidatus Thorarchaeota archaeon]
MPYSVKKIDGKGWCLVRANGTVKQCHDSKSVAERARKAIMMHEGTAGDKTVYEQVREGGASSIHSLKEEGKFRRRERSKH